MSGIVLGDFHKTQTAQVLPESQQKLFLSIFEIWDHCGKDIVLGDLFKGVIWHKIIAHLLMPDVMFGLRNTEMGKAPCLSFRSSLFSKMQKTITIRCNECYSGRQRGAGNFLCLEGQSGLRGGGKRKCHKGGV